MKKFLLSFLVGLTTLFSMVSNTSYVANAQENVDCITKSNYTSVVDDLSKLDKYKDEYKSNTENKFITLTQAYDQENNLKTYAYLNYIGGNDDYVIISISTSLEFDNFRMIQLNLISYDNNSNLKKYEIEDLDNLENATRKYKISSFSVLSDISPLLIINFDVKPIYYFNGTTNDNLECYYQEIETITITDKQVSFFCYGKSMNFFFKDTGLMQSGNKYTDAWYVFFNTDKKIDNLISIDLSYVQFNFCVGASSGNTKMDYVFTEEWVKNFVENPTGAYNTSTFEGDFYVRYNDVKTVTIKPGTKEVDETQYGWFGVHKTTYETLDNIMDLRKYKTQDEDTFVFTEYADTYTWGIHFNDTYKEFEQKGPNQAAGLVTASAVTEVTILSLTFETDHKVKTLLAIDTPSKSEDNQGNIAETPKSDDLNLKDYLEELFNNFKNASKIFSIFALILSSLLLVYLFAIIFKKIRVSKKRKIKNKKRN